MPIFAHDILRTGPQGLGMLRAAPALGALAMSLTMARFPLQRRAGRKLFFAVAVFGASTVVFGLSHRLGLSLAALAVAGAADMILSLIHISQGNQREGGIGAGDQQVDGGVVEDVKDMARPCSHQRVVERGAEVNQDQRGGEDAATDHIPGGSPRGGGNQVDRADDGHSEANSVGDGVGQNVAKLVMGLHIPMIERGGAEAGAMSD